LQGNDLVTESPPNANSRRQRSRRVPPTIDLQATSTSEADPAPAEAPHASETPADVSDAVGAPSDDAGLKSDVPSPSEAQASRVLGDASGPETREPPEEKPAAGVHEPAFEAPAASIDEKRIETAESREPEPERAATSALDAVGLRADRDGPPDFDGKDRDAPGDRNRRREYGLGALLGATALSGLVGAGLALFGMSYLTPPDRTGARLALIEERVGAAAPSGALAALERRLAAVEPEQRNLAGRLDRIQAQAEAAAQRAQEALNRPAPQAAAAGASTGQLDPAALEALDARLAALEGELRALRESDAEAAKGLEARFAEQGQRLAAFEARATEQNQQVATVAQQLAQQGQQLTQLSRQIAQQGQQTAQQGDRLAAIEKQLAELGPKAMASGVRVVAADRVSDALRDGAPFPHAFTALQRLDGDAARLAPLEPFAQVGAPTAAALADAFKPLGQRIIAEARGPATGWTDRLWRMAEGVVSVRPMGETGSTAVPSLVARIENALSGGRFQEAVAAWDALPEPARRLSEEWGKTLKARAAADEAAKRVSAEALAALDAATR
jgi:uncharacterized coiled-coil protein SlyX